MTYNVGAGDAFRSWCQRRWKRRMANSARQRKVADEYMRTVMSVAGPDRVKHVPYIISVLESFDYLVDPFTCSTRHK